MVTLPHRSPVLPHPCKIIKPHAKDCKKNEISREETLMWHEYMSTKHVTLQATAGEMEEPGQMLQMGRTIINIRLPTIEDLNCSIFPVVNNAS